MDRLRLWFDGLWSRRTSARGQQVLDRPLPH
jgi:hypothetical protein